MTEGPRTRHMSMANEALYGLHCARGKSCRENTYFFDIISTSTSKSRAEK